MLPAQHLHHAAAPQRLCSPYAGVAPTATRNLTVTVQKMKRMSSAPFPSGGIASPPHPQAHPGACLPPLPTTVRNIAADSGLHAQEHPDDLFRGPVQSCSNLPRVRVCKKTDSYTGFIHTVKEDRVTNAEILQLFYQSCDHTHSVLAKCVVYVVPEELRHSMPNLAPRTSLRSLEAVRNSRSMEANLQSSGNRMSHLTHSPSTGNPTLLTWSAPLFSYNGTRLAYNPL